MNKDIVLSIDGLKTQFKVGKRIVHAVNDVSLSVKRGKTLGIVGESGCGKSVTAHSVVQLLPKTGNICKGTIKYSPEVGKEYVLSDYKRDSKEIRSIRGKHISMIFQDPLSSLDPVYTIGKQIEEILFEHEKISKNEARKRIIDLLAKLGIPKPEERYNHYPHQFSGGMKQRVMIAIAMVCNPKLLIADEPTTALDVTIQAQILSLMRDIQKDYGTSIILITHNMGIVAEACDEVAVMYMGRIVEYGPLEKVFNNPLHPYTSALLRSVPVLGIDKNTELRSIRGNTPDGSDVFQGCEFSPRCDQICQHCKDGHPPVRVVEEGHEVRCWLYEGSGGSDHK
ncbi:MAG: ABC transporter ATP-binding protein [Clostridiales bacterium]|nr:ABC transporter ATP-binding protein [Clostridiales bacterium]